MQLIIKTQTGLNVHPIMKTIFSPLAAVVSINADGFGIVSVHISEREISASASLQRSCVEFCLWQKSKKKKLNNVELGSELEQAVFSSDRNFTSLHTC